MLLRLRLMILSQKNDLTEDEQEQADEIAEFIGFCDICCDIAVTDCDDCGRYLCAKHAYLHDGIQCSYCLDDYYNSETGEYDDYGYDSTPETDAKISRFARLRTITRRIINAVK
jgi:hypothetical protein